jgi:hypothetical protein
VVFDGSSILLDLNTHALNAVRLGHDVMFAVADSMGAEAQSNTGKVPISPSQFYQVQSSFRFRAKTAEFQKLNLESRP